VDQEAERGAGRQRSKHSRFGAVEIEGDYRQRAGDDHAHAGCEAVDAIGQVDDVHHHHETDDGQHRARVGGAGIGEVQRAGERQGDRLDGDAEVHDDHGGGGLAGELDDRRQVEAVVKRTHDGDERRGDQHPMPHLPARAIAGRQERQRGDEHTREDREAPEQRRRAARETALPRLVHGAHGTRQPHRERRQQRGHGRGN
jgi:hypothetical protein